MPRSHGVQIQNNFIGGLNTEATALKYPPNCCTETDNVMFDDNGRMFSRGAIDLEDGYVASSAYSVYSTNEAFVEYLWTYVGSTGTTSFLVQQQGKQIHFYDVSTTSSPSANKQTYITNLDDFKVAGTVLSTAESLCDFAQGNGYLIVVNPACSPFYITFNNDTRSFSATAIVVQYRDFYGLDDGYALTARPSFANIAAMKADPAGAEHYYNLLNQGWWQGPVSGGVHDATKSAFGLWDAARTDMPSNADAVGSFRSSPTVPLDTTRVDTYTQGNTPAPKGHFILELGVADRVGAAAAGGFSVSGSGTASQLLTNSSGIFGDLTNNAYATDGLADTNYATKAGLFIPSASASLFGYTGVLIGAAAPVYSVNIKAIIDYTLGKWSTGTLYTVATLYGKNGLPASASDGTALSAVTPIPANTMSGFSIASNDTTTTYTHVWVLIQATITGSGTTSGTDNPTINLSVSETSFYKVVTGTSFASGDSSKYRPSCTAFFASRAWYAGLNDVNLGNNLYFSQIMEQPSQLGYCYQQNDPTSEVLFGLLPSDGGVIRIPEMGKVVKLFNYQTTLLVFATNGVWTIRGSSDRGGFTADNFAVRKISSIGTQSPKSFVDVKGFPVWWSEEGIQQIDYNPQFDSFQVNSLTQESLKRQYLAIPAYNRRFTKGAYDSHIDFIYWLYSDNQDTAEVTQSSFNKVLIYHTKGKSFATWTLPTASSIQVKGVVFVQDSIGISNPQVKFISSYPSSTNQKLVYAELKPSSYTDWAIYAADISGNSADTNPFVSSAVSGYRLDGEVMKFFQNNYITVVLENVTNSGCYVQGVFNSALNGNSGGWGTKQSVFNSTRPNDAVVMKRLKIRGKGRIAQLKFTSKPGQPFTIIGWSVLETANADV